MFHGLTGVKILEIEPFICIEQLYERLLYVQCGGFVELVIQYHTDLFEIPAIGIGEVLRKPVDKTTGFADVCLVIVVDKIHDWPVTDVFARKDATALITETVPQYEHVT